MNLCKICQWWLTTKSKPIHTPGTSLTLLIYFKVILHCFSTNKQYYREVPEVFQYTHDTGTHCGVEVAHSMASSTPFTLSSTLLLTRTTSKKCPYVVEMSSDSFWIICRFSVYKTRQRVPEDGSCWSWRLKLIDCLQIKILVPGQLWWSAQWTPREEQSRPYAGLSRSAFKY